MVNFSFVIDIQLIGTRYEQEINIQPIKARHEQDLQGGVRLVSDADFFVTLQVKRGFQTMKKK